MKRAQPEYKIQVAVASQLRARAAPGVVWFHPANGGWRNLREAARLKYMGVRPGASDIIAFHRGEFFALELKAPKGRPTEAQLAFIDEIKAAGGFGVVAEGLDEAVSILECWGLLKGKAV